MPQDRATRPPSLPPVPIAVAPNGGRRTKADHPALPMTPAELAATAADCLEAGAAMIHVHVRDRDGRHLLNAEAYRDAIKAIRAETGERMVIQITSEALGIYGAPEQMAVVRATRPRAVSLALREIAPDAAAEPAFADFLGWLKAERIAPQFILYEPAEAVRLDGLRRRGLVPFDEPPVLYVLGRYTAGQTSTPQDLLPFLAPGQPVFRRWMCCAFGHHEAACTAMAGLLGGGLRVGFENNLRLPTGETAPSNADLVRAAVLEAAGVQRMTGETLAADWSTL
ncbi:MAG: 3-keto-5-aminohexanoate cleavage protein [Rhizobiaceae bacterium]|nr:3-keto-5-aminohexanoate cleavage protein [Rhizobiaceae bacterium]MCV0404826.1 3-keto-5-aminohexanoate cleavage protein [Rhizobiaceae bacterium]